MPTFYNPNEGALYDPQDVASQAAPMGLPQPQNPMLAAMQPAQDPNALQAFYGRMKDGYGRASDSISRSMAGINARPDGRGINEGLIAAGVNMLGAKDLQSGLAGGAAAFQDAYGSRRDQQRAENAPKVSQVADGAFTVVTYPDGTQKIINNREIGKYQTDKATAAAGVKAEQMRLASEYGTTAALTKQASAAQIAATADQRKADLDVGSKADAAMAGIESTREQFKSLRAGLVERTPSDRLQAFPGFNGIASFLGTEGAVKNQQFKEANVKAVLDAGSSLKGATSDKDMMFLQKGVPDALAANEIWADWLNRAEAATDRIYTKLQAQSAKGQAARTPQGGGGVLRPAAPAGPSGALQSRLSGYGL